MPSDWKRGVTAARVADAVWNAYRFNRREVVVPKRGNLVIAFSRLLPGVFDWGMMKVLRRMKRTRKS